MDSTGLKSIAEAALIEKIAARFKTKDKSVVVSIGDDAAVVSGAKGKYLLYTVDMLVESVHFRKNEDYRKVGYKAMAVSVSDIAAMGGRPRYALVSVGLPKKDVRQAARGLYQGIEACAKRFNFAVIGGDTNRSPHLVIDVFMTGEVERRRLVLRSGAQDGNLVFVSGALGGSLSSGRHLNFTPRLEAARFLVEHFKVTSMIDLSDGLAMDLNRICAASRAGALIFEGHIPRAAGVSRVESALFDGEDFELLFTLSGSDASRLLDMQRAGDTPLEFFQVGEMTHSFSGVRMRALDGRLKKILPRGFRHF